MSTILILISPFVALKVYDKYQRQKNKKRIWSKNSNILLEG